MMGVSLCLEKWIWTKNKIDLKLIFEITMMSTIWKESQIKCALCRQPQVLSSAVPEMSSSTASIRSWRASLKRKITVASTWKSPLRNLESQETLRTLAQASLSSSFQTKAQVASGVVAALEVASTQEQEMCVWPKGSWNYLMRTKRDPKIIWRWIISCLPITTLWTAMTLL